MKRIIHIVGARPNFIKVAPVHFALQAQGLQQALVHTGQHYTPAMSDIFFRELGIPSPDISLGVGSGTHAEQTSEMLVGLERLLLSEPPDLAVVYGDVNSTLAAALVCAKLMIPVAHVEAGLRSFDRGMPEEINRVLTDHVSSLHFTPSPDADENLRREGISQEGIHCVGNVMIDTLKRLLPQAHQPAGCRVPSQFALATLHRPSNVDNPARLRELLGVLGEISGELNVIFPVHPRTANRIVALGLDLRAGEIELIEPLSYLEFLYLQKNATVVITDSGGIQEETTYLGVPCLTVRENTERPVTVQIGTNTLIGKDLGLLRLKLQEVLDGRYKKGKIPNLWDGNAAKRIAALIAGELISSLDPVAVAIAPHGVTV